jgi:hypothetical protein
VAKRIKKEDLFKLAFKASKDTVELIDLYFLDAPNADDSLTQRIFGVDLDRPEKEDEEVAKRALRKTALWGSIDTLYDYAVDGVLPSHEHAEDIVIGGAEAMTLVSSENVGFGSGGEAFAIVSAADGRFALDNGEDLELSKLADLAGVDDRSVRNAVSAGELAATKGKPVYVDNQSARMWLNDRRGYKPTITPEGKLAELSDVSTPTEFGAFLKGRYNELYPDGGGVVLPMHPAVTAEVISDLRAGIFRLPLDACSALADFYQLDRKLFLLKVMEVFYDDELRSIRQSASMEQGGAS